MQPADMILFAAVARASGFTRAAAELGVSKQVVSERVRRLERDLGVRLFERTTRSLRLTDAGASYFERCKTIASMIDEANDEVRQRQSEPVGTLRITAPVLSRRYLGSVLGEFMRRYPRVRVEVILADRRVDLVQEGFDLALRVGELDDSSLAARRLGDGYAHYVASPRLLARLGTITAANARTVPWIALRPSDTWKLDGKVIKSAPVLVVNDLESICEAAVEGLGMSLLPALLVREHVRAGRLRVLFGPEPAMRMGIYAVYPSRSYLPVKVRRFIDLLATMGEPMLPLEIPRPRKASSTQR